MKDPRFSEVNEMAPDGKSTFALINGDLGWLMYLREPGDPGFSSRNPKYAGAADATIEYVLGNGQVDEYPASWALPAVEIRRALTYFREHHKPPPFISWHNDSGDGSTIPSGA